MADIVDYRILGEEMQMLEIALAPAQAVRAQIDAAVYMEDGIEIFQGSDGLIGGLKRLLQGDNFSGTNFFNACGNQRRIGFAGAYPGKIIVLDTKEFGEAFLCQRQNLLCLTKDLVMRRAAIQKFNVLSGISTAGLQGVFGDGQAFLHAGGEVVSKSLRPGETMMFDFACLVAFAQTIDWDIQGSWRTRQFFGGRCSAWIRLTGPGKVFIQTLPVSRVAAALLALRDKTNRRTVN